MAEGHEIRVLTDEELEEATGTPGMHRRVAFESDDYWFGHVEVAGDAMSGWHHHGKMVTIGMVTRGKARFEFGPGGQRSIEVDEGGYFMVPAGLIHREGNPTGEPGEVVLVRIGEGPPVVDVDGPEPEFS